MRDVTVLGRTLLEVLAMSDDTELANAATAELARRKKIDAHHLVKLQLDGKVDPGHTGFGSEVLAFEPVAVPDVYPAPNRRVCDDVLCPNPDLHPAHEGFTSTQWPIPKTPAAHPMPKQTADEYHARKLRACIVRWRTQAATARGLRSMQSAADAYDACANELSELLKGAGL